MSKAFKQHYGQWAIVTGASSGLGEAFAHSVAQRGIPSLLIARQKEELDRVASQVEARHGIVCATLAADLADATLIDGVLHACVDRDIGLIVGNAAYNPAGAFVTMSRHSVAEIGFDYLGRGPVIVPGSKNRWMQRIMRRLPRAWVVKKMAPIVRAMVERSTATQKQNAMKGNATR